MALFFKQIDKTVSKEALLFELNRESEASEGALRVYITKLRKVGLEIETLKGTGYRLVRV
ncbi:MAG: helix-turn-helix domain-containing protein [Sulfurimonas sp.]|nr:helix-turn-helix domain-containing protein [Sulfurimonas sp.]